LEHCTFSNNKKLAISIEKKKHKAMTILFYFFYIYPFISGYISYKKTTVPYLFVRHEKKEK